MILSYAFNHFMRSYKENRKQYVETIMCEENIRTNGNNLGDGKADQII